MTALCTQMSKGARMSIVVFAALLALPLILSPFVDRERRAAWEKRPLISLDDIEAQVGKEDFFSTVARFIDDSLYGALRVNRYYRQLQFYGFGDAPVSNVVVTPDGMVFLTSHNRTHPRASLRSFCAPRDDKIEALSDGLRSFTAAMASRDINVTMAVVPSKFSVYTDRLPQTLSPALREACLSHAADETFAAQQLANQQEGYRFVYPLSDFDEHRDEPHFYPPENFHANSRANFVFAEAFLRDIGIVNHIPGVEERLADTKADLGMLGFSREIKAFRYRYAQGLTRYREPPSWLQKVYPGIRQYDLYTVKRPLSERRALLLANSFGAYMAGHIAAGFTSLTHINMNQLRRNEIGEFFEASLRETRATDVIVLVHDAALFNAQVSGLLGIR